MRTANTFGWIVLGIVVALSSNRALEGDDRDFRLDHFKVYKVEAARKVSDGVALRGQFDRERRKAEVTGPLYFANPVSKNRGKILDKDAHLNWYRLAGEREPRRAVTLVNQFGDQKLVLGAPAFLLAPTRKAYKGETHPISRRLDHFKAYRVVEGKAIEKEVILVDQFDDERNVVLRPVLFCVPVAKTHADKTTKINNEKDHLVVYELKPMKYEIKLEVGDQFSDNALKTSASVWLCVPSHKLKFEEMRERTPNRGPQDGERDDSRQSNSNTDQSSPRKSPANVSVRLSLGVALPQTLPTGTAIGFSVNYGFSSGSPGSSSKYFWVITNREGQKAELPINLKREGQLQAFVGWQKYQAPFSCHIEEVTPQGDRRAISEKLTLR